MGVVLLGSFLTQKISGNRATWKGKRLYEKGVQKYATHGYNNKKCDECGSLYYRETSKMESLCPECSHWLYGYKPCEHDFYEGHCNKCHWDGSVSEYIKNLKIANT
jgi:hypothetical protein